jgi:hypothetical protein
MQSNGNTTPSSPPQTRGALTAQIVNLIRMTVMVKNEKYAAYYVVVSIASSSGKSVRYGALTTDGLYGSRLGGWSIYNSAGTACEISGSGARLNIDQEESIMWLGYGGRVTSADATPAISTSLAICDPLVQGVLATVHIRLYADDGPQSSMDPQSVWVAHDFAFPNVKLP